MQKLDGQVLQAMPLGMGLNATSPFIVEGQRVIEFLENGSVTLTFIDNSTKTGNVLGGSRYAIAQEVTKVEFSGKFNVG